MKISTKTGDKGESRLFSGRKAKKSDAVFEVLGDLDELNAVFGLCKSGVAARSLASETTLGDTRGSVASETGVGVTTLAEVREEFLKILEILQKDIYRIMSVAGNDMSVPDGIREIDRKDVLLIEQYIEKFEEEIGEIREFEMPGGSEISARFHLARTVCRRAERKLVAYGNGDVAVAFGGVPEFILQYMNRISDLLFLMACL